MVRIGIVSVIPAILESNSQREVEENERELILENQRQLIEIPVKLLTDSEQEVSEIGCCCCRLKRSMNAKETCHLSLPPVS